MDELFPIIDENINPCRGCPDYDKDGCKSNGGCGRPQTNADRIRAMTDEELAQQFMDSYGYAPWCHMDSESWCENDSCKPCCEKWLKSPVEVDNGT